MLDDARGYEVVCRIARPGGDDELWNQAIPVLGRLGRREGLRDHTREALTGWLDDPDEAAQAAAVAGLGALGDPRSIADLERVRFSGRPEEVRGATRQAVEAIRRPEGPKQATAVSFSGWRRSRSRTRSWTRSSMNCCGNRALPKDSRVRAARVG